VNNCVAVKNDLSTCKLKMQNEDVKCYSDCLNECSVYDTWTEWNRCYGRCKSCYDYLHN
jgi:hypothetical protein